MALRPLILLLMAPLTALILMLSTPASAHDGHRGQSDRYQGERYEKHVDRRTGHSAQHHRAQRAHRNYYRKQRKHFRKHYRPVRKYRRHRQNRRPSFYFRW